MWGSSKFNERYYNAHIQYIGGDNEQNQDKILYKVCTRGRNSKPWHNITNNASFQTLSPSSFYSCFSLEIWLHHNYIVTCKNKHRS